MALETTMRSRERLPRNILRMALCAAALAACPAGLAGAQERLERLERDAFDVIPPSERVAGAPGEMQVWQAACRVGPTHWARRRIVDVAAQEWGYAGGGRPESLVRIKSADVIRLTDAAVHDVISDSVGRKM